MVRDGSDAPTDTTESSSNNETTKKRYRIVYNLGMYVFFVGTNIRIKKKSSYLRANYLYVYNGLRWKYLQIW